MQNLSDDELDKLFQSAAEGYDAPGASDGWKDMEKRLADAGARGAGWKLTSWKGVAGIVSVIAITSLIVWNINRITTDQENLLHPQSAEAEKIQPVTEPSTAYDKAIAPNTSTNNEKIKGNPDSEPVGQKVLAKNSSRRNANEIAAKENRIDKTNSVVLEPTIKESIVSDNNSYIPVSGKDHSGMVEPEQEIKAIGDVEVEKEGQTNEINVNPSEKANEIVSMNSENAVANMVVSDSSQVAEKKDNTSMAKEVLKEEEEQKYKSSSRWALKLSASPDFSTVKFSGPYGSGSNYSMQVQYSLSERMSLSTGVIWAKKVYSAKNFEYSTSGGATNTADNAEGDCDILDIPINVYYKLYSGKHFSWFGSLGLSSYLMMKEKYKYSWIGSYNDRYSEVRGENNEWLKVVNISVVAEKRLSGRFSIQAEPFVKIPLSGIGEGKINLSTLGTFISLQYKF
ncbi:MAG: hypothetical protein L0Y35_01660 [Flammeovirgaceae bacterium]|nr:hypothetical protein [Flammeovirgaceae bacterium]